MSDARSLFFRRLARRLVRACLPGCLTFVAAAGAILLLTWPWAAHFSGEFLAHWDPPFHAWKLEFMARNILRGDLFLTNSEANVLYPHAGALYFEALQWPPALLAAALFRWTAWPSELVYHVVLVIFWALSAPCMYALLRELGLGRAAAGCGSLLFCTLPHRISYMVEFQMQLIFALPLFYLFLLRFLRRQRVADGIGLACAWWLQAVCELYQAVFLLLTAPFIVAACLSAARRRLLSRRFWIAAGAGLLTAGALLHPLLTPYLLQRSSGAMQRSITEVVHHSAQPLGYLLPFNGWTPWRFNARLDEFSLYPTLPVLLLALLALAGWGRRAFRHPAAGRWFRSVLYASVLAGLGFAVVTLLLQNRIGLASAPMLRAWDLLAMLSVLLAAVLCLFPVPSSDRNRFILGLLAAAVFSFFLSLGPSLSVGDYGETIRKTIAHTPNTLYCSAYRHWLPMLTSFRVVSRFGVIVLLFLVVAAAAALDRLCRVCASRGRAGPAAGWLLALLLLAVSGIESANVYIPQWGFRPVERAADSPVLRRLDGRRTPFSLAMLPMDDRYRESMRMFALLRERHLSVYGWGGFRPLYARKIQAAVGNHDAARVHALLANIWPETLLLIDGHDPAVAGAGSRERFPAFVRPAATNLPSDLVGLYTEVAEVVDQDDTYTLMRLKPPAPARLAPRIFRSDLARRLPVAQATLRAEAPTTVIVTLNRQWVWTATATPGGAPFQCRLPPDALTRSIFNELDFVSATGSLSVDGFCLVSPTDAGAQSPATGAPAARPASIKKRRIGTR